jgi:hypothetical protein
MCVDASVRRASVSLKSHRGKSKVGKLCLVHLRFVIPRLFVVCHVSLARILSQLLHLCVVAMLSLFVFWHSLLIRVSYVSLAVFCHYLLVHVFFIHVLLTHHGGFTIVVEHQKPAIVLKSGTPMSNAEPARAKPRHDGGDRDMLFDEEYRREAKSGAR